MRLSLLALVAAASAELGLVVETDSLRIEGVKEPLGIHPTKPLLSWRLSSDQRGDGQTAYQIQASSDPSRIGRADLWDSGKVSNAKAFARWDGNELSSRKQAHWRVRVWGADGSPSPWSDTTFFEVGILDSSDWTAGWIENSEFATGVNSLPMFAKDFKVSCKVDHARLYVTGLGVYRAEINGEPVTDELMGPGYSTLNRTLYYRTYDVTDRLKKGANVIGVAVGKGAYNQDHSLGSRYRKLQVELKPHLVKSQLEYTCENGDKKTVNSDDTWKTTTEGPLLEAAWYGGEELDARKIIDNWSSPKGDRSDWRSANASTGPPGRPGKLVCQSAPQLKIVDEITPVSVKKAGDQYVFDFGVNYAGWFSFKMNGRGKRGIRIEFRPSELLDDDGAPDQKTTGNPIFDGYTMAGEETETFTLQFMYHGHQYIGVNTTWEPELSDMTGLVIRAANEQVSKVETSNDLFNKIHRNVDRSIQGNMHSVLTDCPHREKLGWLEQDHLVFEPLNRGYDLQAYGKDMMRTITDAQAQWGPKGLIPETVPEFVVFTGGWEIYRSDPNWGNAVMTWPVQMYQYYGDETVLSESYPIMEQYMEYLAGRSNGSDLPIIDDGIGLRDWAANDKTVPIGFTNTFAYHQAAAAMKQIAKWLGKCDDARKWRDVENNIRTAFHKTWFSTDGGQAHYSVNNQATNALALDMGAVPEKYQDEVFQSMIDQIEKYDYTWTLGEIALPSLLRTLRARERDDVIFKLMTQTKKSSYGYQIEQGATSLWEHWNGTNEGGWGSLNHFMFGAGDYWLQRLSGLAPRDGSVRWNSIDYSPIVVGDLTHASSTYRTPTGEARASWKLSGKELTYDITVPVGSTGYVTLKSAGLRENGKVVEDGRSGVISSTKAAGGKITIRVASGTYRFQVEM